MGISFSTKALTLLSLKKIIKTANIAPIYILKKDWVKKKQNCKDDILNYFKVKILLYVQAAMKKMVYKI